MDQVELIGAGGNRDMYAGIDQYRQVARSSRVLTASPAELAAILYQDLLDLLRQGARPRSTAPSHLLGSRALMAVMELEAGLDFERGGDLAQRLHAIYRHVRKCIAHWMSENDPFWCQKALETIEPIAEAWEVARSRA